MKQANYKKGFLISVLISGLITFPRLLNPNVNDVGYIFVHFIYMSFQCFLYWFVAQWFVYKKERKALNLVLYLILCGILSVVFQRFLQLIDKDFTPLFANIPFMQELSKRQLNGLLFFRGIAFSGFVYFVVYYLNLLAERQKVSLEIEQLKKEKLEAQLNLLKQQISPHFLFNSLSTLRTIVPDEASKQYILKLSNVYRYLLSFNENNLAGLKDELEFIRSYLYILKERFEDALEVNLDIDSSAQTKLLPPLAIQLLIENAIKHNIVSLNDPLHIKIYNETNDVLVISNNLQPKLSTERHTGKGLENISKRYKLLSGQSIEILENKDTFTVKIPLLTKSLLDQ